MRAKKLRTATERLLHLPAGQACSWTEVGPCSVYFLALFDVLGFKSRFDALGLEEIARRYGLLITDIDRRNEHMAEVVDLLRLEDSAYWTSNGDLVIVNRVFGVYASDSILLWAHSMWPEARGKSDEEVAALANDPATGWMYQPVPCEVFLEACNELVCRSMEVGLPVRGAIAMGKAILDLDRGVYLGEPLIEAAQLERGQRIVGASFGPSFMQQPIPARFRLSFDAHVKDDSRALFGGAALDWPRHWRNTRSGSPRTCIRRLSRGFDDYSIYYENTLDLCDFSDRWRHMYESADDLSVRSSYKSLSSPHMITRVIPVRTAPR